MIKKKMGTWIEIMDYVTLTVPAAPLIDVNISEGSAVEDAILTIDASSDICVEYFSLCYFPFTSGSGSETRSSELSCSGDEGSIYYEGSSVQVALEGTPKHTCNH